MKAPALPTKDEVKAFADGQGATWKELARRHPLRLLLVFALGSVAGPWVWGLARIVLKTASGLLKLL